MTGLRMIRSQVVSLTTCITFPRAMTVPMKMMVFQLSRLLMSCGVSTPVTTRILTPHKAVTAAGIFRVVSRIQKIIATRITAAVIFSLRDIM